MMATRISAIRFMLIRTVVVTAPIVPERFRSFELLGAHPHHEHDGRLGDGAGARGEVKVIALGFSS